MCRIAKNRNFINNIPQSRFAIYVFLLSMYIKTDRNVVLYLCFLFQPPSPTPNNKADSIIGFCGYCFTRQNIRIQTGAVVIGIAWQLDLQLPVQSCEIEPGSWRDILGTTLCDQVCQ